MDTLGGRISADGESREGVTRHPELASLRIHEIETGVESQKILRDIDTDPVEVVHGLVFLGKIEKGSESAVLKDGETVVFVVFPLLSNARED